ncbi:MAG TPA: HAMP domain-containing sensor histidine kinase [Polyangiaceae bacterium]|jgi:signal transduction histidine kinase|nr:HAMP domain-containing sensor histidine kinase [Polyangiaceae bacterium]
MKSIKVRLGAMFVTAFAITLAMAGVLYFGAGSIDETAGETRIANDEVRELLTFALAAHRYMSAFGTSLGQRTLIANNERRIAAQHFEQRIATIPSEDLRVHGLDWKLLRSISKDLHRELEHADTLRAAGKFAEAEHLFNLARKSLFEEEMLPWFTRAIEMQRAQVSAAESDAQAEAGTLRRWANYLAAISALVTLSAGVALARLVFRPVRLLTAGTDAMARGDFTYRIPHAEKEDELGVLAKRFNEMASVVESGQRVLLEKNKALEQAYLLQGEFLSIVSHELRSPLHSILGLTELIMEDGAELPAPVTRNVRNVALGARRLLALINDILDFSKLKAGRMQVHDDSFRAKELAELVVEETRALAQGRAIDVRLDSKIDDLVMRTDETKVRQILTNLMSNAVKFTDSGSVVLRVRRASDEQVSFHVVDTGVGIPTEQLAVIFEPFRQAQGSDRRAVSGTGLGLAIVSRLSTILGGQVTVTSTVGKGTEFAVTLPARTTTHDGPHPDH